MSPYVYRGCDSAILNTQEHTPLTVTDYLYSLSLPEASILFNVIINEIYD
jgi:hypothetical protein